MPGSSVALVADDKHLADAIAVHLHKHTGQSPLLCSFASAGELLAPHCDGLLLLAIRSAADQESAMRLVQDISLHRFPTAIVIVEGRDGAARLQALAPHVSHGLCWPAEAGLLSQLVRQHANSHPFQRRPESLEELLRSCLLAQTPSLLPLVDRIALACTHHVTVLLTGETGTGKTFLARLIHDHSPRKHNRFLTVSCGALAANLVESEFFGHVKGAFTGADRPKVGKFSAVGAGTLFLDEIDTLGLEQQATLLRVIETGEFEPVGSIETLKCKARLIVASNLNLEDAVERGRFRSDLY